MNYFWIIQLLCDMYWRTIQDCCSHYRLESLFWIVTTLYRQTCAPTGHTTVFIQSCKSRRHYIWPKYDWRKSRQWVRTQNVEQSNTIVGNNNIVESAWYPSPGEEIVLMCRIEPTSSSWRMLMGICGKGRRGPRTWWELGVGYAPVRGIGQWNLIAETVSSALSIYYFCCWVTNNQN